MQCICVLQKGKIVMAKVFVELQLELSGITCISLIGPYNYVSSIL